MPRGLKRFYGCGNLHFITGSCYRRLPLLNDPDRHRAFLDKLEALRVALEFVVVGYVLMPEHFYLLIGEPNQGTPSTVMFALKQQTARAWLPRLRTKVVTQFWQSRFYDRNFVTENERVEKLRYMQRNPVKRELVSTPQEWPCSSYNYYLTDKRETVQICAPVPVSIVAGSHSMYAQRTRIDRAPTL